MDQFVVDLDDARPAACEPATTSSCSVTAATASPPLRTGRTRLDTISYEIVTRIGSAGAAHLRRAGRVRSPSRAVLGVGAGLAAAGVGAALGLAAERWTAGRVQGSAGEGGLRLAARRTAAGHRGRRHPALRRGGRAGGRGGRRRLDVAADHRVLPRLLPQPGHLALPAAVAARAVPDGVLGPARARPLGDGPGRGLLGRPAAVPTCAP